MEIKRGLLAFNDMKVKVSADSNSLCNPSEDLDTINEYESIQLEFYHKEKKIILDEHGDLTELLSPYLYDDIFNDKLYGYVPLQTVSEIIEILFNESEKKKSIEKIKKEKPTNKTVQVKSRKLTKKQAVKIVNEVITALNDKVYEKQDEIRSLIVALLAKENVLLIGNPGEGKTQLVKELSNIITDGHFFGQLMKEDTMYDDLFGGMNTTDYLEDGVVNRTAEGMIQSANIVFLDEIFKSNGGVLNGILDLVNEREFDNNGVKQKTPLVTSVGASNEFPDEEDNLEAFYDRFLLKHWVKPMEEEGSFMKLFKREYESINVPQITLNELEQIHGLVDKIKIDDKIYRDLYDLTIQVRNNGFLLSTRRIGKCINILKANAFIEGRSEVVIEDLMILQHILWNDIEDKDDITDIIIPYSFNKVKLQLVEHKQEIDNIMRNYNRLKSANKNESAIEYGQKIKAIQLKVQKLMVDADNDNELKKEVKKTLDELGEITRKIHESALSHI